MVAAVRFCVPSGEKWRKKVIITELLVLLSEHFILDRHFHYFPLSRSAEVKQKRRHRREDKFLWRKKNGALISETKVAFLLRNEKLANSLGLLERNVIKWGISSKVIIIIETNCFIPLSLNYAWYFRHFRWKNFFLFINLPETS